MAPASEHGTLARGPAGTRLTDGFEVLRLDGDRPATIVSVESVGGESSLRFLGAYVAGPERKLGAHAQLKGFPPRRKDLGEIVPAEGALVIPRDETRERIGYELLLGYEVVDDTEIGFRSEIVVTYRVDDEDYEWRSPARLVYCPDSATSDECFAAAGLR